MREKTIELRKKNIAVALLVLLSMTSCIHQQLKESEDIHTPTISSEKPTSVPETPPSIPDLTQRPLIWFAPLPKNNIVEGSIDFMDLFTENSPWTKAAGHVQVFKLYGGWVADFPWDQDQRATDTQLKQLIADLNRRGLAIAFEASPLVATESCGQGIEGFFGPEEGLRIVRRIKEAGGTVIFVALDEPFAFGNVYDGPNACKWPAEKIAKQVNDYIRAIKSVFPNAIIGDIEPLWAGMEVDNLKHWVDTYYDVTGSHLPFLHIDVDFTRSDWPEAVKELERFAKERGIEFGIIYKGDYEDFTDEEWLAHAEERMVMYEVQAGGQPDHVIFQSWNDHPDYVLPETKQTTFTHLINRYFLTRTVLSLTIKPASADGSLEVIGTLTDTNGTPLEHTPVEFSVKPLEGQGVFAEYTLSSIVPDGAIQADVGFRINTECGCSGTSDFVLYEVRYLEGEESTNRVHNANFALGLEGWDFWGEGTFRLERNDRGQGWMLHVMTTPSESFAINSSPFSVTPGKTYTLTFSARVSPSSIGSGYFDIVFSNGTREVARKMILLEPGIIKEGNVLTNKKGEFKIPLDNLPQGTLLLEVIYVGDNYYWPAYAAETIKFNELYNFYTTLFLSFLIVSQYLSCTTAHNCIQ